MSGVLEAVGKSNLVEVDVHALQLKVGGAIVAIVGQLDIATKPNQSTYMPEPSRPCSPEMFCLILISYEPSKRILETHQKAAPIWLPFDKIRLCQRES